MKKLLISALLVSSTLVTVGQSNENTVEVFDPIQVTTITVHDKIVGYSFNGMLTPAEGPVDVWQLRRIADAYGLDLPERYKEKEVVIFKEMTRGQHLKMSGNLKNGAIALQTAGALYITTTLNNGVDINNAYELQSSVVVGTVCNLGALIMNVLSNIHLVKAGEALPEQEK
jgi:hypothetical protein